jgi:pterin-4a-carbinolamine dehydratase
MLACHTALDDNRGMPALAFISYRRTDSQQAALGLHSQLRARIGPASVFMDRSGISAGDVWPERLRNSISQASLVLVLMGPGWLRSADDYGRRRLDIPDDWVRNELLTAIAAGKPIIPILLGSLTALPPRDALPDGLRPLLDYQAYGLRDDHWDSDLNELVRLLVEKHEFKEADQKVRLPQPQVTVKPLTATELDRELKCLPGWEPVESLIPGDYPKSRQELRKVYAFRSFRTAIQFMSSAVDPVNKAQHHPRWENQWRTVTVFLSTWDIGLRISQLDLDLARILDGLYDELSRGPAKSTE